MQDKQDTGATRLTGLTTATVHPGHLETSISAPAFDQEK